MMAMRAKKEGEFVNVKIRQDLADQLKRYAAETGFSKTTVVEKALDRYFYEHGDEKQEVDRKSVV